VSKRLKFQTSLVATTLALALALTACSPSSSSKSNPAQQASPATASQPNRHALARQRQKQLDADAQQLDTIPPPDKPRYMAVASSTHWQNPFLTIHQNTVELRIPAPPAPPVKHTRRGRKRPHHTAPLWKTTTLTLDTLPAALAALPESNWPYGRVIATRDDLSGPPNAKVQVRRNEEKVLNLLNNLGVVTYEWPQNHKR
jgi:hypothetical protein